MSCCIYPLFLGCFKNCDCVLIDLVDPLTALPLVPEVGDWIFTWSQDDRTYHNFVYTIDVNNTELNLPTALFNPDNYVSFALVRPDGTVFYTIVNAIEYDCFKLKVNQYITRNTTQDCHIEQCDICDIATHGFTIVPLNGPVFTLSLNTEYPDAGNYTFNLESCTQHIYLKSIITLLNGATSITNFIEYRQVAEDFNEGFYYSFNLVNYLPTLIIGDVISISITFIASSILSDLSTCNFEQTENLIINIL